MPARTGPSVWVRPTSPLPASHPAWAFLGSSACGRPSQRESRGLRVPCSPPLADVNECETGVHQCGEGQVCHNLPGSYRCDCKVGFQRDAFGRACVGRWALVAGSPRVGSGCPRPALRPPPPSALLCWHAGRPRLDRLLPSSPAVPPCCCPPCFSRSWLLPPSFLAPCCVRLHPWLCLQPPSNTLAAFLVCPGLFASPVPCPGSSLSLPGVCVPVLTQPPLLPGGGGSGLRATLALATGHPRPARRSPADVNECWTSPGRLCQHTCENTLGSYRCSCASGFLLAADGKRCEGTTGPNLRPRTDAEPPWKAILPGSWPHSFTDPVPTSCHFPTSANAPWPQLVRLFPAVGPPGGPRARPSRTRGMGF